VSRFQHERINHSTDFAKGENHINGIENFFQSSQACAEKVQWHSQKIVPFVPERM